MTPRPRIGLLFNHDWDALGHARQSHAWRFDEAGFDLFSFPSNARLVGFDLRRFAAAQARRGRRRGWVGVASQHEQFGALAAALTAEALGLPGTRPEATPPLPTPGDRLNVLTALQLQQPMGKRTYARELEKWQGRLNLAARDPRFKALSVVAVFEGNDGAGKGSAIRRVTHALDARHYTTVPVAAPTEEERAQPYLWRFWRHLPRRGRFALFDRSWYGRVLVERVEGLCAEADWLRAYGEINDFEAALVQHRVVLVKFWLAISKDEQYRRFKHRETVAFKRFKITDEDWRNRAKWDDYEAAVCDMVDRTSTATAPWTLVEADNKYHARIKVLKTLCQAVEQALAALPEAGAKVTKKRGKKA